MFRKLVTNKFIHGFDYTRDFAFKTVHHRTAYSYCACACGFQLEYIEFVTKSGSVNEVIYQKILHCILVGRCAHVEGACEGYVREASVTAFHIAAAVGTTEPFKILLDSLGNITDGLYDLSLHEMALIKNPLMHCYVSDLEERDIQLLIPDARRLNEDEAKITVRYKMNNIFEHCVMKGELPIKELFTIAETSTKHSVCAMHAALKYDLVELQDMLKRKWRRMTDAAALLEEYCTLAIVYDKSELLHYLLHQAELFEHRRAIKCNVNMASNLNKVCEALQRHDCKQVLLIKQNFLTAKKYDLPGPTTQMSLDDREKVTFNKVQVLSHLLFRFNLRETILPMLRAIPNVAKLLAESQGEYGTILHGYNCSTFGPDPVLLKEILDLGVDINHTDSNGMAPLIHLLTMKSICPSAFLRCSEELYVFENPDMQVHESALVRGLRIDRHCHRKSPGMFEGCGPSYDFILDGREHGIQGYDGDEMTLNFMVPFLIECGFPVDEDFLEVFECDQDLLDPVEQVYIRQCLETPRSLLLQCRDTLRKHYGGRRIHRYVEMAKIPQTVRDFILIKPFLKCVPSHLLY